MQHVRSVFNDCMRHWNVATMGKLDGFIPFWRSLSLSLWPAEFHFNTPRVCVFSWLHSWDLWFQFKRDQPHRSVRLEAECNSHLRRFLPRSPLSNGSPWHFPEYSCFRRFFVVYQTLPHDVPLSLQLPELFLAKWNLSRCFRRQNVATAMRQPPEPWDWGHVVS